jgi:hypothetical protein
MSLNFDDDSSTLGDIRKGCLVKHKLTDAIGFVMSKHEVTYKVRWQGVLCDDGRLVSEAVLPPAVYPDDERLVSETPQYYSYAYKWDLEHYHDYDV